MDRTTTAPKVLPSPEVVRRLLRYEPDTGKLFWRERPPSLFSSLRACRSWNTRYAGAEAFTASYSHGYRRGTLFNNDFSAHRIIWAIVTGEWPAAEIDHRNNETCDNRWENLRAATRAENCRNRRKSANNKTGAKGVHYLKAKDRWTSCIKVAGRSKNLGSFTTVEAAHKAYASAVQALHGEFGRTE